MYLCFKKTMFYRCITRLDPDYADTLEQASLQDECTKKKMSARNASNGADRDGQKFCKSCMQFNRREKLLLARFLLLFVCRITLER